MEVVVFIGIPGSGKSSFYKARYFSTHVRVSLDLLNTRHREQQMMNVCLETDQRFVIDNTNPTKAERSNYIEAARIAGYSVVGYYFQSKIEDCLRRNAERPRIERVPDVAILSVAKKLELPALDEGFDKLFYVQMQNEEFVIEEWKNEI